MPNDALGYDAVLTLNRCGNVFSQAPCTATAAPGFECYNCFQTCQDKPNYVPVTETITLTDNLVSVPYEGPVNPGAAGLDPDFILAPAVLSDDNHQIDAQLVQGNYRSTRSIVGHTDGVWGFQVESTTDPEIFPAPTNPAKVWVGLCVADQELDQIPGDNGTFANEGYGVEYGSTNRVYHNDTFTVPGDYNWTRPGERLTVICTLDSHGGTTAIDVFGPHPGSTVEVAFGLAPNEWFAAIGITGSVTNALIHLAAEDMDENFPVGVAAWGDAEAPPIVIRPEGYPCLTKPPKLTSAHIKRGVGLATLGAVTITARDFVSSDLPPLGLDPYWATRETPAQGTFFPRLKARYPYMQRSPIYIVYYTVDQAGTQVIHSTREYVFDTIQGPDSAGNVIIKGRDLLSRIDAESAVTPFVDNSELTSNINNSVTTIGISNAIQPPWATTNGEFTVGDEAISYAAFDGVDATGCVRGLYGTTPIKHDAGDRTQVVTLYANTNIVDVIYDLLVTYAAIDPIHIPYNNDPGNPDEWDIEKEAYLAGHTINHGIAQPARVGQLLKDLLSQAYLHMWYEPTTAKIRLAATNTRVAELEATRVSEEGDILANTIKVKEIREGILTQAWTYFDKYSYTLSDEPQNYGSVFVSVNTELEDPNAWGTKNVRPLLANWLRGAGNIAITTNNRTLNENNAPRYEITFQVDASAPLLLGQFIIMSVFLVQNVDGVPIDVSCQIIKHEELVPTARTEITATIIRVIDLSAAPLRFGNIVNVANESVDYPDATPGDQDLWCWISTPAGFDNGDAPYVIL